MVLQTEGLESERAAGCYTAGVARTVAFVAFVLESSFSLSICLR